MLPLKPIASAIVISLGFVTSSAAFAADGKQLYDAYCMSCHQADGYGVPFQQPPLASSPMVNGPADALISFVIEGTENRTGWVSDWDSIMPGFASLEDDEMAALLTHIRSAFGNHAPAISQDQIKDQRPSP